MTRGKKTEIILTVLWWAVIAASLLVDKRISMVLFMAPMVIGLLWAVAVFFFEYLLKPCVKPYTDRWAACPHGLRIGNNYTYCKDCVEDRRKNFEEEDLRRKAASEKESKQKILLAAKELSRREAFRLRKNMHLSVEEMRQLTWQQFEDKVASMYERLGYEVTQTPYSNDFGVDCILRKNGKLYIVQCKKYHVRGPTGRPDLQQFHSALISRNADKGFFVTTGTFSRGAIEFAHAHNIDLIFGDRLLRFMAEAHENSESDIYSIVCSECGDSIEQSLRNPQEKVCKNGHLVPLTLTLESVFSTNSRPDCHKCGKPMRIIKGKKGKFWGCSGYPTCHSSQAYKS